MASFKTSQLAQTLRHLGNEASVPGEERTFSKDPVEKHSG